MKLAKFNFEDVNTGLKDSFSLPILNSGIDQFHNQKVSEFIGVPDIYEFAYDMSRCSMAWVLRNYSLVKLEVNDKDSAPMYIRIINPGELDFSVTDWLGDKYTRNHLAKLEYECYYKRGEPPTDEEIREIRDKRFTRSSAWYVTLIANYSVFPYANATSKVTKISELVVNKTIGGTFHLDGVDTTMTGNPRITTLEIGWNLSDKFPEKVGYFGILPNSELTTNNLTINKGHMWSVLEGSKYEEVKYVGGKYNMDEKTAWDDIDKRFPPVAKSKGVAMYKMTKEQVHDLFHSLYTKTLAENIRSFLGGENVNGAIQSLTYYYHWGKLLKVDKDAPIQIYDQVLDESSGKQVVGLPIQSEYVGIKMGSFKISPMYNNFLDYAPYTSFMLNIPMYGAVELNATDIMNRTISLRYVIDVSKNIGMIFINLINQGVEYAYKKLQFTPGVNIPVNTTSDGNNKLASLLTGVTGSLIGGAVGGGVGAMAGGTLAGLVDSAPQVHSFSGGSTAHGHLDLFTPELIRMYPALGKENIQSLGKPVALTGKIGNFKGYVKTGNITSIGSTKYKDKIENLLKNGVYI